VTAAIPARAVGMAATANKRDAQIGRARSLRLRYWDLIWHSRKGCYFGRNGLVQFTFSRVFFFAYGTVSCLILPFSMQKQQKKRILLP
jgi:hypothetical protein